MIKIPKVFCPVQLEVHSLAILWQKSTFCAFTIIVAKIKVENPKTFILKSFNTALKIRETIR